MKFENMDLEQLIDNEVNVGEHIAMDDILDNVVEDDSPDESGLVLNEAQAHQLITGLCIDVKEIADFHGSAVYQMVEKYL